MERIKRIPRTYLQPESARRLAPLAGIVIGVLLIATGVAVVQAAGAAVMAIGLLLARGAQPSSDAESKDLRGELAAVRERVRQRVPDWAWPAAVALVIALAAIVLVIEVVGGDIDSATFGNLGKGAIALVMMATVALWWPVRLPERFGRSRKDPPTVAPEPADPH